MTRFLSALAALLTLPCAAIAATDGDLSENSSEATMNINLVVNEAKTIQISGFEDIEINWHVTETAWLDITRKICVYMEQGGTYDLQIVAEPLTDGSTIYPYYYYINGDDGFYAVDSASTDTTFSGRRASSTLNCDGGDDWDFYLSMDGFVDGIDRRPRIPTQGTAEAIITMTVTPN